METWSGKEDKAIEEFAANRIDLIFLDERRSRVSSILAGAELKDEPSGFAPYR
jgi:hypothetical protein